MRRPRALLVLAAVALAAPALVLQPAAGQTPQIDEARQRANEVAAEYGDAESRVGALEQQVEDLRTQAESAEEAVEDLRAGVRELAVAGYVGGSGADNAVLLSEDLNVGVQRRALTRFMAGGDLDDLDRFRAALEDAEAAGDDLDAALEEQEDAVEELAERRAALDAELDALEEAERQRQAAEARRRAEEERRQAAEAAAAAAESARTATTAGRRSSGTTGSSGGASASPAPAPSAPIATGAFVCPVQGPHTFIDSWGYPRSGGRRHQGVDMMARIGVPTVAPVSGRVEHRGNSVGGLSWHLYGDDGTYYYGTHLSSYANQGAGRVEAGTVIGYVGDSGNARGIPHLHFEIHPGGGAAVNPYPTVARAC